jgi:hypothetical protein
MMSNERVGRIKIGICNSLDDLTEGMWARLAVGRNQITNHQRRNKLRKI